MSKKKRVYSAKEDLSKSISNLGTSRIRTLVSLPLHLRKISVKVLVIYRYPKQHFYQDSVEGRLRLSELAIQRACPKIGAFSTLFSLPLHFRKISVKVLVIYRYPKLHFLPRFCRLSPLSGEWRARLI
jgi:hypothetical protein